MEAVKLQHAEMVQHLCKPGYVILETMTGHDVHLIHMAIGISGEAGELLEGILKTVSKTALDLVNIVEELGDIEFYLEGLRTSIGVTYDQVLHIAHGISRTEDHSELKLLVDVSRLVCAASRLLDTIKKKTVYRKELNLAGVVEEMARLEYHTQRICLVVGVSRKQVLEANIAKLSKRYAGGYSDRAAQERADKTEEAREA